MCYLSALPPPTQDSCRNNDDVLERSREGEASNQCTSETKKKMMEITPKPFTAKVIIEALKSYHSFIIAAFTFAIE